MVSTEEIELLGFIGILMCAAAVLKLSKKRRPSTRRFKTRPINRARISKSQYDYFKKMTTWDEEQFFKYTRMTIAAFNKLLNLIRPFISKERRRDGIFPEQRLVITLQYVSISK